MGRSMGRTEENEVTSVSEQKKQSTQGGFFELVKVLIQAGLLAFALRTFLFQPFNIPSGSMKSTLLVGDYIFVSKYSYGISRYSFPYGLAPISGRVFGSTPERGDVVVFKLPSDNSTDYIKRLIGLPGDRIRMRDGILYLNGEAVKREYVGDFIDYNPIGTPLRVRRYRETLPNGAVYETLDQPERTHADNTGEYVVPEGHFFMMGDNRDNSQDSRVLTAVGYVPFENLVGKAQVIFFSVKEGTHAWEFWMWPWSVRWDRIFTAVR